MLRGCSDSASRVASFHHHPGGQQKSPTHTDRETEAPGGGGGLPRSVSNWLVALCGSVLVASNRARFLTG